MGRLAAEGRTDNVRHSEKALGVTFRQPRLLHQALIHRSYHNEHPETSPGFNERLEYLGDAVIQLIVSDYLYTRFPDAEEDRLTTMRAALVRATTLGRLALGLGLGQYLYLNRPADESGARIRIRFLGQVFEAVVGAIYADQGLKGAREFVLRTLMPDIDRVASDPDLADAKSHLNVVAPSMTGKKPAYELVSAEGPLHQPHFVVRVRLGDEIIGRGEGESKQGAEQIAAREALARLSRLPE